MSDRDVIEAAYADLSLLGGAVEAVTRTIDLLDGGHIRVAEKRAGTWEVNEWVKEAILLYFRI
ncbi:MAG: 2,3,4,5-tetrahydropyridine-2,6-dicarboxylate N-succinyltransferase, partial [Acidimicrobiia bacterium]